MNCAAAGSRHGVAYGGIAVPGMIVARFRVSAAAALGICLSGCGSLLTLTGGSEEGDLPLAPRPFGGVRLDAAAVGKFSELELPLGLAAGLFALDLPLSLAIDVLTLPVTIPLSVCRESQSGDAPRNNGKGSGSGEGRPRGLRSPDPSP